MSRNHSMLTAGEMTRRAALQRTLLGAGGLMLGGALAPQARAQAKAAKAKAVIQIWMWGGPCHLDTFDPKPEAGNDFTGPLTKPIETNVSGIRICELLPLPAGAEPGTPRGSVEHLHVINVAPERMLRMSGGLGPLQAEPVSAVFTVSLKSEDAGTRVTFDYRVAGLVTLKGGEIAGPVDQVLAAQLARLAGRFGHAVAPEGDAAAGQARPAQ